MWLFAMEAAKLPTHCKAKDTEMDDFGSVIHFLYIIIVVIEQEENHSLSVPTYNQIMQTHSKWIN